MSRRSLCGRWALGESYRWYCELLALWTSPSLLRVLFLTAAVECNTASATCRGFTPCTCVCVVCVSLSVCLCVCRCVRVCVAVWLCVWLCVWLWLCVAVAVAVAVNVWRLDVAHVALAGFCAEHVQ